jgi:methylated-DNA-[protein]-cysteine S-methyltransferase
MTLPVSDPTSEPMTDRTDPLETALRALTWPTAANAQPPVLDGDVTYTVADTPVGPLLLARSDVGLVACSYDPADSVTARLAAVVSPRVLRDSRGRLDDVRRGLDAYFSGERHAFDGVRVDLALASPFARSVLGSLTDVPYGTTTTYGAVAAKLGRPSAARAVGRALGGNPVCVVLPCHRVTGASGALTGYAGGLPAKRLLLSLEGALGVSGGGEARP